MNFKKFFVGFIIFFSVLLVVWRVSLSPVRVTADKPRVQLVLDFSTSIATYDGVLASTAFEALTAVSLKQNIPIQKKQYDFGVFVEGIGSFSGTKDKAWIYHVNGISGEVAADKKILNNNDIVLWKYMKPNY